MAGRFVRFRIIPEPDQWAALTDSAAFDPNVWSGRALQEDFVDLSDVRSCINVSGL
jgi:hypothetical protein